MPQNLHPFLMFEGRAAEAMAAYAAIFDGAAILTDRRYGPEMPGKAGQVMRGLMSIKGTEVMLFDSPVAHAFGMTPAVSLFITCDDEAEIDRLFATLSDGGEVRMPLGNYGFSRKFGWTDDRFGVSWQLNLP